MWLILPLVFVLAWRQTGSLWQGFNGTIGWIVGYAITAGAILLLDFGGYDGIRATPDSPGAAFAILGGFVGMWISNIRWRRRGGDPPREPGKWERALRAAFRDEKKRSKPRPQRQAPPAQQLTGAQRQASASQPIDAQYQVAPKPSTAQRPPSPPRQQGSTTQRPPVQSRPPRQGQPRSPNGRQHPSSADKYAKATGRALGAMFRGNKKSASKRRPKPGPRS